MEKIKTIKTMNKNRIEIVQRETGYMLAYNNEGKCVWATREGTFEEFEEKVRAEQ